jgi:hypothetical protein
VFRLFSVVAAVAALAALASVASAQTVPGKFVRCSVATVEYPMAAVMDFASTNHQGLVDDDAAACSSLIGTGYWMGADKYTDWESDGYTPACTVTFNSDEQINVYVLNGSAEGSIAAVTSCSLPAGSTASVKWYQ